jgi:hypothetical protein
MNSIRSYFGAMLALANPPDHDSIKIRSHEANFKPKVTIFQLESRVCPVETPIRSITVGGFTASLPKAELEDE